MGIVFSLIIAAAGAILRFAVTASTSGINLNTVGVILMVIGGVGLLLSLVFWSSWGGFGNNPGYRRSRQVTQDGAGGSYVEERGD